MKKRNEPTLYPLDRDMTKTWYVQYPNPNGGRPLKKYGALNHLKTVEARLKEAETLMVGIRKEMVPLNLVSSQILYLLEEVVTARLVGKKRKTRESYQSKFNVFAEWYRQQRDQRITPYTGHHFLNWVSSRNTVKSNTTINGYRRILKGIFGDLKAMGQIDYNPFEATRKFREIQSTKSWFSIAQQSALREMIANNDQQLWIACMIQFYCFVRPGDEMRSLRISSIVQDQSPWKLKVEGADAKVGRYRYIPIADDLQLELQRYIEGFPDHYYLFGRGRMPAELRVGLHTLYNRHCFYLDQLGLGSGYSFYSWKNTGAVMMYRGGMKFKTISMLMGHTKIDTTNIYFKSLGIDDVMDEIVHKFPSIGG